MVFETPDDVIAEVLAGNLFEHRHSKIELKETWEKGHGAKISALANKTEPPGPAWLCIGITDKGQLTGRDEKWAKNTEEVVSQHLNSCLDPAPACEGIFCRQANSSWVVLIKVVNPGAVTKWDGEAYKAAGTTLAKMEAPEVMALTMRLPGLSDYSAQSWDGVLSDPLVKEFAGRVTSANDSPLLHGLSGKTVPEILSALGISGRNAVKLLFGSAKFRMVYYDENEEPCKNISHVGIYNLLSETTAGEIQNWPAPMDRPRYPAKALKEALANAVAHAAYFEGDGEIVVEVFVNRLSISNLCLPESAVFANKWFSRSHRTVNGLLMEVLRLAKLVDEVGRGKSIIFSESIKAGKKPPSVSIERSGRFDRWRLIIHGGTADPVQLRLFERVLEYYKGDVKKALIANALIFWRKNPVKEIQKFIDGESAQAFAEILTDIRGPVFWYRERDEIIPRRWVQVLLGEGQESKQLTSEEESRLLPFAREMSAKYGDGTITPERLRELGEMQNTQAEQNLSSRLLKKWQKDGHVEMVRKGLYRFRPEPATQDKDFLVKLFNEGANATASPEGSS